MYKWYHKHEWNDRPLDEEFYEVFPLLYVAQRPIEKDKSKLEQFVKPNIKSVGYAPIQDSKLFPNGLFLCMDDDRKSQEWMFFVFPMYKKDSDHKTHLIADHFSYVFQKNINACQFHQTNYVPQEYINEFWFNRNPDHFPIEVSLARIGDDPNIIKKPGNQRYKAILLDLMRYPWTHGRPRSSTSSGGAKKEKYIARPIMNPAFNGLWAEHSFKSMIGFGLRKHGETHVSWSISFVRKGRRQLNRLETAYTFETPDESEHHVQAKLAELIPIHE